MTLAILQASKKRTMPIQNWRLALNRFIIEFGDQLNGHMSWRGQSLDHYIRITKND